MCGHQFTFRLPGLDLESLEDVGLQGRREHVDDTAPQLQDVLGVAPVVLDGDPVFLKDGYPSGQPLELLASPRGPFGVDAQGREASSNVSPNTDFAFGSQSLVLRPSSVTWAYLLPLSPANPHRSKMSKGYHQSE